MRSTNTSTNAYALSRPENWFGWSSGCWRTTVYSAGGLNTPLATLTPVPCFKNCRGRALVCIVFLLPTPPFLLSFAQNFLASPSWLHTIGLWVLFYHLSLHFGTQLLWKHARIGSITARKCWSNFSGVCFILPLIHQSTISTKLPDMWFTKKSSGKFSLAWRFCTTNWDWISPLRLSLK